LPVVPRQWDAGAVRLGWTYRSSTLLLGTIGNIAERIKINYNMDESTFGWLIEYEQQLREAGYDEKTIAHLVLEAVK
jgi:hypothetical protein